MSYSERILWFVSDRATSPGFALLPNELMLMIAAFLNVRDFSSLAQTATMVYQLLKYPLYRLALSFNRQGSTSYFFAAVNTGNLSAVRLFVDTGASVDERDRMGCTPLHRCSINDNEPMAQLLIDKGSAVSAVEYFGATPLHKALHGKQYSIARLLLKAGADIWAIDVRGRTPLHETAAYGTYEVVKLLLDVGADCAVADYCGRNPSTWPVEHIAVHPPFLLRKLVLVYKKLIFVTSTCLRHLFG